jgi:hypothetical protein
MKSHLLGAAVLAAVMCLAPARSWALGFGADVGIEKPQEGSAADTQGLFGRLGLIGPLDLQLDYARAHYDGERTDSRYGIGLRLEPFHLGHWIPALWAGAGVIDVDSPAYDGQLDFRELGLGLVYAFNDFVRLELDLRQGSRDQLVNHENGPAGETYRSGSLALSVKF